MRFVEVNNYIHCSSNAGLYLSGSVTSKSMTFLLRTTTRGPCDASVHETMPAPVEAKWVAVTVSISGQVKATQPPLLSVDGCLYTKHSLQSRRVPTSLREQCDPRMQSVLGDTLRNNGREREWAETPEPQRRVTKWLTFLMTWVQEGSWPDCSSRYTRFVDRECFWSIKVESFQATRMHSPRPVMRLIWHFVCPQC